MLRLDLDGHITMALKAEPPWSPMAIALRVEDLYT
jgi:hypothetical protein